VVVALAAATAATLATPSAAYQRPGHYTQVDLGNDGKAANGSSAEMSIDGTGRFVAFSSTASNLGGGAVPQSNVYVRDMVLRRTTLVSRGMGGQPSAPSSAPACPNYGGGGAASGTGSDNPAISTTGRYVAFASTDVNLVRAVTNDVANVYVYDRAKGQMRLASVSSTGALANGWSCNPSVSADGQRVAFTSVATNLVASDSGGMGVFVHDFATGKTVRADVSSAGAQPAQTCSIGVAGAPDVVPLPLGCSEHRLAGSISADGRYVVFDSVAGNLVAGDTNGQTDVFEHDLKTAATVRVSVASGGGQAQTPPSGEDALAPDDVGSFLTNPSCEWGRHHVVSADGRYVLFLSRASNLIPEDTNANPAGAGVGIDVFVHDVRADRTYRVDVSSAGEQNGDAGGLGFWTVGCDISMSEDGRYVSMISTGGFQVYDRVTGEASVFPTTLGRNTAGTTGYSGLAVVDVSADGRYVAAVMFNDANAVANFDAFVWDRGRALAVDGLGKATASGSTGSAACGAAVDPGLRSASTVYRPNLGDVFVRLSLAAGATARARLTGVLFGIDLTAAGRHYEVRADGGDLGLYDGAGSAAARLATLPGGFGATGEEVVFAVPLRALGLPSSGRLSAVAAYAAIGTTATGPSCVVDRIRLS
jgi:Tol biopolymer transport system component